MVKDNNKDSLNPKLILILIALLILLMLAGGYLAFSLLSGKEDKTATTPEKDKITQTTPEKGKKDKTTNKKKKTSKKVKKDKDTSKDKKTDKPKDKKKTSSEKEQKETIKDKQKDTSKKEETDKTEDKLNNVSENEIKDIEKGIEKGVEKEIEAISEDNQKPVKLADLKSKAATKKQTKDPNNKLNQMPLRALKISSPFAFKKEVIQVEESNFADLQKESVAIAGKFSPFEVGDLLPMLDDKNKIQNKTSSLPEITEIPDNISLPPGLEGNILSTDTMNFDQQNNESMISSSSPPSSDELDSASLTGIIGDSAIINFNGQSRALHVGQNYKGIVVLSISDKSVLLELNGVKVIKELRDRF